MALTDHVVVLAHLQPQVISAPPAQNWEETLRRLGMPEETIAALPPSARAQSVGVAGDAVVSASALDIRPGGIVTEVDWPCSCGARLHAHHDFVLAAWAKHVAEAEGIDADHLERHAVQEIDGKWRPDGKPRVHCRCGARFESASLIPDLTAWEQHVRAA